MDRLNALLDRLAPPSQAHPERGPREVLGLCAGLVILLGLSKPLLDGALGLPGAAFTLAAAWQLVIPLDRLDRARIPPRAYGIHAHGLVGVPLRILSYALVRLLRPRGRRRARAVSWWLHPYTVGARLDGRGAARSLGLAMLACAVTFPPFAWGYVEVQRWLAAQSGHSIKVAWQLPAGFAALMFTHLVVVAVPEELFYRGYVHTLLARAWPPRVTVLGAGLGKAVLLGSAWFALGHFVGEWNPTRLLPFFPALLFCALRSSSGSILAAVVYHGLSNVIGEVVRVSVTWS
ncbi:MAG: CPBP family intramembrane metalloprotease [Deltaproteobacteria bacterium]|nr:CPBP family intramembrane metalloprotease [Deltaproteobacteria bacterium]